MLLWKSETCFPSQCDDRNSPVLPLKHYCVHLIAASLFQIILRAPRFVCDLTCVRCRFGSSPLSQGCCSPLWLFLVASDDLWPRFLTYTDNMFGMKTRPLHDLIWRGSPRDIERALFGDVSSFLPVRDIHIPKFPPSCVSSLCRPGDLSPPEQSHLISTSGGTMSGGHVHSHYPEALINVKYQFKPRFKKIPWKLEIK